MSIAISFSAPEQDKTALSFHQKPSPVVGTNMIVKTLIKESMKDGSHKFMKTQKAKKMQKPFTKNLRCIKLYSGTHLCFRDPIIILVTCS